jgi:hypothetical protein
MSQFEDELKSALGRKDPSPGFSERLLARIAPAAAPPVKWKTRARWWLAMAASLLLTAGVFQYHHYQQQDEGRKAKKELMLALHIAGSKLNVAQRKVLVLSERTIYE